MREFLRGWQRKAGSMTLLMSLVCMVGWLRSISVLDWITVPVGGNSVNLCSGLQTLSWQLLYHDDGAAEYPLEWITLDLPSSTQQNGSYTIAQEADADSPAITPDDEPDEHPYEETHGKHDWSWHFAGFALGVESLNLKGIQCSVPYWFIVVPLTLLSAYLLRGKPQRPKATSITSVREPTSILPDEVKCKENKPH